MAHVDSEVSRALGWIEWGNPTYSDNAFIRPLAPLFRRLHPRRAHEHLIP